jgi:hypothetical protein
VPVWHASVSSLDHAGARFLSLPRQTRRLAVQLGVLLLNGVGEGETRREAVTLAAHFRRRLSNAELSWIDPAWLAIHAVDVAGGGTSI